MVMDIQTLDVSILNRPTSIAAYLVPLNKTAVLIDCGPESQYPKLVQQLKKAGYAPEDISYVLPTHIHLDHAGSAWHFAALGAKIVLHPFGAPHMIEPSRFMESATRIYKDKTKELWGELRPIDKERVQIVADGEIVTIEGAKFQALHTPGHAKHHITWLLEDKMFAGDVGGCRISSGPVIAPTPPPDLDFEQWEQSVTKMEEARAKELYITHYGCFTDLSQHFADLRQSLALLKKRSEVYYDLGMPAEEISLRLMDAFEKELDTLEIDQQEELARNYQAINPLWMNAQGLYRYWQKKKPLKEE